MRLLQLATGDGRAHRPPPERHGRRGARRGGPPAPRPKPSSAWLAGAATGPQGLLEAHGVLFDLAPEMLELLDIAPGDLRPVVTAADLPIARVDPRARERTAAERDARRSVEERWATRTRGARAGPGGRGRQRRGRSTGRGAASSAAESDAAGRIAVDRRAHRPRSIRPSSSADGSRSSWRELAPRASAAAADRAEVEAATADVRDRARRRPCPCAELARQLDEARLALDPDAVARRGAGRGRRSPRSRPRWRRSAAAEAAGGARRRSRSRRPSASSGCSSASTSSRSAWPRSGRPTSTSVEDALDQVRGHAGRRGGARPEALALADELAARRGGARGHPGDDRCARGAGRASAPASTMLARRCSRPSRPSATRSSTASWSTASSRRTPTCSTPSTRPTAASAAPGPSGASRALRTRGARAPRRAGLHLLLRLHDGLLAAPRGPGEGGGPRRRPRASWPARRTPGRRCRPRPRPSWRRAERDGAPPAPDRARPAPSWGGRCRRGDRRRRAASAARGGEPSRPSSPTGCGGPSTRRGWPSATRSSTART